MADSTNDKARKAKILASKPEVRIAASETAMRNAKTAGINLTPREEAKAAEILRSRIKTDRTRTASRAEFIANREENKSTQNRIAAATGSQAGHHVTTVPPKKNAMNKSERDFEAGQKLKAKITKKTGVYPNTAN